MSPTERRVFQAAILSLALGWGAPSALLAGEVYGRITEGTAPVGEAATVAVACGDKSYPARPTDQSGSYHIVVGATGKCTLTVTFKGLSATLAIVSYEDETQVDVVLDAKDGKLSARRK